jgi:hypothetical protein
MSKVLVYLKNTDKPAFVSPNHATQVLDQFYPAVQFLISIPQVSLTHSFFLTLE